MRTKKADSWQMLNSVSQSLSLTVCMRVSGTHFSIFPNKRNISHDLCIMAWNLCTHCVGDIHKCSNWWKFSAAWARQSLPPSIFIACILCHGIASKLYLIYEFIHIYLSSNEPWSNIFYNTRTSRKLNSLVLWFCLRDVDSYRSNCWLQSWKPELNSLTHDAYVRWKLLNKSLFVVNLNPRDENSFRYTHTAWALRTPSRVCWHSINVFVKYQIYGEYSLN